MQQENPYSFIVGDESSRGTSRRTGQSKKQRILIVGALFGGLLIAFIIFLAIVGGGNNNTGQLISLANRQAEIIRISQIGEDKARSQPAKNLAVTTKLSMQSAQADLIALIQSKGQKISAKSLSDAKNSRTDQTLEQAEQNNRFDDVFIEQMTIALSEYRKAAALARDSAQTKDEEQILSALANHSETLSP